MTDSSREAVEFPGERMQTAAGQTEDAADNTRPSAAALDREDGQAKSASSVLSASSAADAQTVPTAAAAAGAVSHTHASPSQSQGGAEGGEGGSPGGVAPSSSRSGSLTGGSCVGGGQQARQSSSNAPGGLGEAAAAPPRLPGGDAQSEAAAAGAQISLGNRPAPREVGGEASASPSAAPPAAKQGAGGGEAAAKRLLSGFSSAAAEAATKAQQRQQERQQQQEEQEKQSDKQKNNAATQQTQKQQQKPGSGRGGIFSSLRFESRADYDAAAVNASVVEELLKEKKLASVLSRRGSSLRLSEKGSEEEADTGGGTEQQFDSRKSVSSPGLSPTMVHEAAAEAGTLKPSSSSPLLPAPGDKGADEAAGGEAWGEGDDPTLFAAVPAPPRGATVSAAGGWGSGARAASRLPSSSSSSKNRVWGRFGRGEGGTHGDSLDADSPAAAPFVQIKVVIYGGIDMEGKKLYCKFYHGCCKHKTSVAATRRNPEWREWFIIDVPLPQQQQQALTPGGGGGAAAGGASPPSSPSRSRPDSSSSSARGHKQSSSGAAAAGGGGGGAATTSTTTAEKETGATGSAPAACSSAVAASSGSPRPLASAAEAPPPVLRIEVWGSSFLGREVKGFCDIDLSPVLRDYLLIDGLYTVYGPAGGRLRVKLINMSLLPRWERTAAAEAALRMTGEEDPEGVLAMIIDDLKRVFLGIPYTTIVQVLRDVDWRKQNAFEILSAMRAEKKPAPREARKTPSFPWGTTLHNGAPHDSALQRKRQQLVKEVARMLPDVDEEEIEYTLRVNGYDICAAVDDLIAAHRETTHAIPAFGEELRAIKLASKAEAGGFVALESQGNMMHVRHSSAMPPDREGVGERKFRQRVMMFERHKSSPGQPSEK